MFFRHHVVFGQVISGQEVVREIENQKTDASSKPYAEVRILSCGELIPKSKGKVELYIWGHFACFLPCWLLIKILKSLLVIDDGMVGEKVYNIAEHSVF